MIEQEQIKQQIEKLLELLGVEGSIAIEDRSGRLAFNIHSADSRLLIGQYGNNLMALQHVARLLVRKLDESQESVPNFVLDVEDYRKEREVFLEELAQAAAKRVEETKEALTLKPMNSYDRYVIHAFLATNEKLVTESTGEGEERRVIIKPKT